MLLERFESGFRRLVESDHGIVLGTGDWVIPDQRSHEYRLIFPGSFNPLHDGHRKMAEIAKAKFSHLTGIEISDVNPIFEISITNVDKSNLNVREALRRATQFHNRESVCFSMAKKFTNKADLFPNSQFVIGLDTLIRLIDPKYYAGSITARDDAINYVIDKGCTLLVFGRIDDLVFRTLDQMQLPSRMADIAHCVSEREFRCDVSSTQLRNNEST